MSINMKEVIDHAIAQAMSTLTEELADQLGLDEVELEVELETDNYWKELLKDLKEAAKDKAEFMLDQQVSTAERELQDEWVTYCLPIIKEEYEQDGVVDGPARREDWCNFIDAKCRNGDITEVIAGLVDADVEWL